ncbi:2-dehydro-3-deoxygluconokinase [Paenibacillus oryzae]|uniref:2-dehydro-3-deoxygluconokinase n=1 Tax=Paenibacillus oryzae TaxID=1844972 RepID=A0A1A5YJ06_9BACL|nr:sugar kinase [Paenibacillus oryzae]OBR65548.1 2-dehydro-3-deoxygluconokinase [Paenibacillus oryzae]
MSRIAAFGEVMMRLEVPGYSTLAQENRLAYSFSGSGVNVLSAMSRYGHDVFLLSALPDNSLGEAAFANLRRLGLSTRHIKRSGQYIGMYVLEKGFGARASKVTYNDRQGSSFNTAEFSDEQLEAAVADADVIHFCGIALAMNDRVRDNMLRLAGEARRQGKTIVFDCNYRPSLWGENGYERAKPYFQQLLGLADIVLMNEKDAIGVLGMSTARTSREEQLEELIPAVAKQYNIRAIAGTHRRVNGDNTHCLKGFLYNGNRLVWGKERSFLVYDRVGAGDAYASGIMDGLLRELAPEQIVEFASSAARLAHTFPGDTPMSSREEIVKAMSCETGDVER